MIHLVVLCDDLIFASRIAGTARARGISCKTARSIAQLGGCLQPVPEGLILDLGHPELNIETCLAELRAGCVPMPRVVAYGSHVDVATLKAAREAGCDYVLPRSKFVEELEFRLAEWIQTKSDPAEAKSPR